MNRAFIFAILTMFLTCNVFTNNFRLKEQEFRDGKMFQDDAFSFLFYLSFHSVVFSLRGNAFLSETNSFKFYEMIFAIIFIYNVLVMI